MTTDQRHDIEALGPFVLGALEPEEDAVVRAHLADCRSCRDVLEPLREVRDFLDAVPVEAFLEGAPGANDLLLPRTVQALRAGRAGQAGRGGSAGWRRVRIGVSAAALVALAFGGGVVAAHQPAPAPLPPGAGVPGADATALAGTALGSVVNPTTGARLTATMEPGLGWVTVHARIGGIPAGQRCWLMVVSRDGRREPAGSWTASPAAGAASLVIAGSAAVPAGQIDHIEIDGTDGAPLVSLPA